MMKPFVLLTLLLAASPAFADEVADATAACDAINIDRAQEQLFSDCVSAQRVRTAELAAIANTPATPDPEAQQAQDAQLRAAQRAAIAAIRSGLGLPQ